MQKKWDLSRWQQIDNGSEQRRWRNSREAAAAADLHGGGTCEESNDLEHSDEHSGGSLDLVPTRTSGVGIYRAAVAFRFSNGNPFLILILLVICSRKNPKKNRGMDEVVSVFPSKRKRLHTTRSWNFLGFPSSVPRAPFESDVIIGMIDSGIWPESKSFDDTGFGPPPSKWKGVYTGELSVQGEADVRQLRVHEYYLQKLSRPCLQPPLEEDHWSPILPLQYNTCRRRNTLTARQFGPRNSHILHCGGHWCPPCKLFRPCRGHCSRRGTVCKNRSLQSCWHGCYDADILSAFDDAIADGVDIISISIGTQGVIDYFNNSIAIGSFHAMKKNILTSSSAGNAGPNRSTIENYAPWMLTVAASTIDRKFTAQTQLGDGLNYKGLAINTLGLNGVMYPLIYGGDAPNASAGVSPSNSSTCDLGTLDGKLVKGKVVLCSEVRSGLGPRLAGAVGAIMQGNSLNDYADQFLVPVVVLGSNDTTHILNYVKKFSNNPTASISKSRGMFDPEAPYVVSFSSRGPNPLTSNILKPDLAAPGVSILAAWKPSPGVDYVIFSGTSMACPHASGAAAYESQNARCSTAHVMSPSKNVDAEFAYGAGQLNPLAATKPGLVYDVGEKDYVTMLCAEGYNATNLRAITGDSSACTSATNATVLGLNYPSVALLVKHGKSFSNSFQRTVTNVGNSNSIYKATVSAPACIKISVEPDILYFETLFEKKSFIIKIEGDAKETILSASLIWSDGFYNVRSPIVVVLGLE
ncbi:hypothetical protein KSP40_PGU019293 [Platanthera guangdongensis]|uniref:Cucumisin n=1 Tax=Platanthera guangdongensis TaxID=2320717 RepID=A0ABR2LZW7_9ASPA